MLLFLLSTTHNIKKHIFPLCKVCKFTYRSSKVLKKKKQKKKYPKYPHKHHITTCFPGLVESNSSTLYTSAGLLKTHHSKRIIFLMALICCASGGPQFPGSRPPSAHQQSCFQDEKRRHSDGRKINPPLTSGRTPGERRHVQGTVRG